MRISLTCCYPGQHIHQYSFGYCTGDIIQFQYLIIQCYIQYTVYYVVFKCWILYWNICKYVNKMQTSKSSPEVSKLSRTMSSRSYSNPGTCLQGSLPEGNLLLFPLHLIFSGELGPDLINSQKWLNYVEYSSPRIYQYNEDDYRFQFLISTKLSNIIDTDITWKQRE